MSGDQEVGMLIKHCPDCGVTMEEVTYGMRDMESWKPAIKTGEKRDDILGKLGMVEKPPVTTLLCPECGLLRQYADLPDEEW